MCYYKDFMNKRILLLLIFVLQISLFHNILASAEGPKNYFKGKFYRKDIGQRGLKYLRKRV